MASATKSKHYKTKVSEDSLEVLSDKLNRDLRETIKKVVVAPLNSKAWNEQLHWLTRIAEVVEMERHLPCKIEDPSLWEGEERALRCVLEEGKLTLLLRMLVEFEESKYGVCNKKVDSESKSSEAKCDGELEEKASLDNKFEVAVGSIILNSWRHLECLQTADIPQIIYLVTIVARGNKLGKQSDIEADNQPLELSFLERNVFEIFYLLMDAISDDSLPEDRVLTWFRKENAISTILKHLYQCQERLDEVALMFGLESLSLLFDTEMYSTSPEDYLTNEEAISHLIGLLPVVEEMNMSSPDNKSRLRILTSEISNRKRKLAK